MKKSFLLLIALFFVVSCGGGGGGSDSPPTPTTITPPAQSLIGTYNLSSFELYYDNGTTIKSTDATVRSYSGTWKLRSDLTLTQVMEINGTTVLNVSGTWRINASTGMLELVTTTGVATTAAITTSGNVLTTNVYVTAYGGREFDHWTKISDIAAAAASDKETTKDIVAMPESLNGATDYQFGALAGQLIEVAK